MKYNRNTKYLYMAITIITMFAINPAYAGCNVQNGTFYANKKLDMTAFAIFMDQGKKADALRMVDDGRIKSSTQATAFVIKRNDPLVYVKILGIGKVWIYKTFLYCR